LKETITLAIVHNDDANHKIAAVRLTSTKVPEFDGTNMWIGTPEERLLLKNYDTGSDRIDAIVVGELGSGSLGEGFIPGSGYPAAKRCIDALVNSTLVSKQVMSGTKYQATLSHECLHVMMDVGGHPKLDKEVFTQARNNAEVSASGDDTALNGRKRITAASVEYEDTNWRESVKELRANNAGLFDDWA
jgi:hypothetical protein